VALWLRARVAADGLSGDAPEAQLAWLDEGATALRKGGRDGSRIGRDIEASRRALGAPAADAPPARGSALARAATDMAAAASGSE
jgi:hypothetical protein